MAKPTWRSVSFLVSAYVAPNQFILLCSIGISRLCRPMSPSGQQYLPRFVAPPTTRYNPKRDEMRARDPCLRANTPPHPIRLRLMAKGSAFTRFAAGVGLVMGLQGGSAAAAANGQIGVQSRAAIHISVSVMPRFSFNGSNALLALDQIGGAEALDFSSNMTGLRFDVVAVSAARGQANSPVAEPNIARRGTRFQHSNEPRLFLVIPD